jgi:hypothetical protein
MATGNHTISLAGGTKLPQLPTQSALEMVLAAFPVLTLAKKVAIVLF